MGHSVYSKLHTITGNTHFRDMGKMIQKHIHCNTSDSHWCKVNRFNNYRNKKNLTNMTSSLQKNSNDFMAVQP